MTHPFIISERMRDGSDAIADWPILNALLLTASMADLVVMHAGGGGYAGYSLSAGVTVVADGTSEAGAAAAASARRRHGPRRPAPRSRWVRGGCRGGRARRTRTSKRRGGQLPAGGLICAISMRRRWRRRFGGLGARLRRRRLGRPWLPRRPHRDLLRTLRLANLDEIDPERARGRHRHRDSACPAPRPGRCSRATTCARQLLAAELDEPVVGTITAQNGSSTTCNGWLQSAVLGTLVLDAAGDGRAHPTGKIGSIGLTTEPGYTAVQSVAGGNRAQDRYLEAVVRGPVALCANVLREASDQSGGFIACARNPVRAAYVASARRWARSRSRSSWVRR